MGLWRHLSRQFQRRRFILWAMWTRILVTPYGPDPQVPPSFSQPPGPFPVNTVSAANWIAAGNTAFDSTVSLGQAGQGPIQWSMAHSAMATPTFKRARQATKAAIRVRRGISTLPRRGFLTRKAGLRERWQIPTSTVIRSGTVRTRTVRAWRR